MTLPLVAGYAVREYGEELAELHLQLYAAKRLIAALEDVRKMVLTTPIAREYDAARAAWEATK